MHPPDELLEVQHFRDQMIAASLKQGEEEGRVALCVSFPRSDDRGLIEAMLWITALRCSWLFPRSDDRGLIEAQRQFIEELCDKYFRDQMIAASLKQKLAYSVSLWSRFPRSDDRGLIEAVKRFNRPNSGINFRDQMIAASLKLGFMVASMKLDSTISAIR